MLPSGLVCATLLSASAVFLVDDAHALIDYVSQARDVNAGASVQNYDTGESDGESDGHVAPDFGPFSVGAGATASISGGNAGCSGTQTSTLDPTAIVAFGTCGMSAESYDFYVEADSDGGSSFDVTFEITATVSFTFEGSLGAFDNGGTSVSLSGPSGDVFYEELYGDFRTFSESGMLEPGTYNITAWTYGSAYANGYNDYASGEYDFRLDVSSPVSVEPPSIAPRSWSQIKARYGSR